MTQIDIEQIASSMTRDARLLGCANGEQLDAVHDWLTEVQDEIARAVDKANAYLEKTR